MALRLLSFSRARQRGVPGGRAAPIRVLVVDDEEQMRLLVQHVLYDAGYETALAADGDEAIALAAREKPFDLLVTDEMMPRMAGHQLARYMRERYLDIKVLYLTGYRDDVFAAKGSLWADEAFLDKPCSPEALRQAVALLLFGRLFSGGPQRAEVLAGHPRDI
ncbi:MAG TPA: response regulator [Vicinamibacterales bacterium]|nr:response regulator [Vicinamibacterales bacterium]